MISVEEAVHIVLQHSHNLDIVEVSLMECCGRVVSSDITANDPFPSFRASIMDGYAVVGPLEPGVYPVTERIHAGDATEDTDLAEGFVAYITTGAMVPDGANAVVKVEDTNSVPTKSSSTDASTHHVGGKAAEETQVEIKVRVEAGANIRQIGSDIGANEVILKKGQKIGPAEVGLLATVGVTSVPCYALPVVGILSTGSELVNPWEAPVGSQIRDSNRAALMVAFKIDGFNCVDLGIVCDSEADLQQTLIDAASRCDVVVTSGGVSMGEADLVKPMLEKLGTVHFGRLNMKPGKPTTFATLKRTNATTGNGSEVLFFGLPGNPVSCLVTKSLLIDPALRKIQGETLPSSSAWQYY
jgi:gephyrin